ncbi:hypothetical protein CSPX01_17211, partial [Colletotrichum filicis]
CCCGQAGVPIRVEKCYACGVPRCAYCVVSKVRI